MQVLVLFTNHSKNFLTSYNFSLQNFRATEKSISSDPNLCNYMFVDRKH